MRVHAVILVALVSGSIAACGDPGPNGPGNGVMSGGDGGIALTTDAPAAGALTTDQSAALRALREEESLARDVYTAVGAGRMVFANIAASEQSHTDAVRVVLARYGVADPGAGRAPGTFESSAFQTLHDDLVARGRASAVASLQVGAEIEELDIRDIRAMRARFTQPDVLAMLDVLEQGSRNHLRAFWRQLQMSGGSYTPQHLDPASFAAIVNSATESGGMGR